MQKLQGVQAQQDAAITQSELGELQRFAQTEPPEVVDFALKAIYSVAQTDPARFDLLYSAHRKIVQQQLQFVTPQEARALKEHAFSSRKAFYGSTEKAEVQKEMKTESSASPVRVENKVKATEIRQMHRADAESEFDRYMKGG
jgi:outer membrane lipopolysaccharide assembly protein LptE/RlpB